LDHEEVAAAIVWQETEFAGAHDPRWPPQAIQAQSPLAALTSARRSDPARNRWEDPAVRSEARQRAQRFARTGGRLVGRTSPDFPARLQPFDWCPPWLWVRGGGRFPARAVAIVGTRRATPSACAYTEHLAGGAAAAGITVVSGLALGIDAAAHRGALAAGGPTLAVLGTGVDRCYPRAHRSLLAELLQDGLAVSELTPGALPLPYHFPLRNRLMAGLCQAVVVVQAPHKSGALITADHAEKTGTNVLAVPGDPQLPENAGSNWLFTYGVRPALGIEDVVSAVVGHEVEVPGASRGPTAGEPLPRAQERLLGVLDLVPRPLEAVVEDLGWSVAEVLAALTALELKGLVEPLSAGRVRLAPRAGTIAARARRPPMPRRRADPERDPRWRPRA
jgi:DNA processing protein